MLCCPVGCPVCPPCTEHGGRWVAARCRSVLHPRCSPSQEEELFPFNLDEFVTVDEVMEESESPVKPQRGQPKGKRKECCRCGSEPGSKRRKERSPPQRLADSQLSFVMLDEIGEEEEGEEEGEAGARLGMLVVDEVVEEEEPTAEVGKEPPEGGGGGGGALRGRTSKPEPLVTVDEIGEVEELPLNEPTELSAEEGPKQKEEEEEEEGGAEEPCPVPDDPSALVTVDEIHEDNEDGAAAAWEEANDDEDDFLADFNRLKEELNFVTVDEVGEEDEEEESAPPGRNPKEGNRGEETAAEGAEGRTAAGAREEGEDVVGVAGPEEVEVPGGQRPHGDGAAAAGPKGEQPPAAAAGGQRSGGWEEPPRVGNGPGGRAG